MYVCMYVCRQVCMGYIDLLLMHPSLRASTCMQHLMDLGTCSAVQCSVAAPPTRESWSVTRPGFFN